MILGKITHAEGMWGIICTIFSILLQTKTAFKKKGLKDPNLYSSLFKA